MANFCYDCTANILGTPPAQNDMRHRETEPIYDLCEGCGWGYFDQAGRRIDKPNERDGDNPTQEK